MIYNINYVQRPLDHTRGSPTAEASIVNMLNIKTNKPRTQRDIFICKPMKYVPGYGKATIMKLSTNK